MLSLMDRRRLTDRSVRIASRLFSAKTGLSVLSLILSPTQVTAHAEVPDIGLRLTACRSGESRTCNPQSSIWNESALPPSTNRWRRLSLCPGSWFACEPGSLERRRADGRFRNLVVGLAPKLDCTALHGLADHAAARLA